MKTTFLITAFVIFALEGKVFGYPSCCPGIILSPFGATYFLPNCGNCPYPVHKPILPPQIVGIATPLQGFNNYPVPPQQPIDTGFRYKPNQQNQYPTNLQPGIIGPNYSNGQFPLNNNLQGINQITSQGQLGINPQSGLNNFHDHQPIREISVETSNSQINHMGNSWNEQNQNSHPVYGTSSEKHNQGQNFNSNYEHESHHDHHEHNNANLNNHDLINVIKHKDEQKVSLQTLISPLNQHNSTWKEETQNIHPVYSGSSEKYEKGEKLPLHSHEITWKGESENSHLIHSSQSENYGKDDKLPLSQHENSWKEESQNSHTVQSSLTENYEKDEKFSLNQHENSWKEDSENSHQIHSGQSENYEKDEKLHEHGWKEESKDSHPVHSSPSENYEKDEKLSLNKHENDWKEESHNSQLVSGNSSEKYDKDEKLPGQNISSNYEHEIHLEHKDDNLNKLDNLVHEIKHEVEHKINVQTSSSLLNQQGDSWNEKTQDSHSVYNDSSDKYVKDEKIPSQDKNSNYEHESHIVHNNDNLNKHDEVIDEIKHKDEDESFKKCHENWKGDYAHSSH